MRIKPLLVLTGMLLQGCDVDFVAIGETQGGVISVRSEHGTAYQVSLQISLHGALEHPLVRIGGAELSWEEVDGAWRTELPVSVDTLRPRIELEIQQAGPLTLVLPLTARAGGAVRQPNGDLVLPMVHGGPTEEWEVGWAVVLTDSGGRPLSRIESLSGPPTGHLVLPAGIAPNEAVAAEYSSSFHRQFEGEAPFPVSSTISSTIHFPIQ